MCQCILFTLTLTINVNINRFTRQELAYVRLKEIAEQAGFSVNTVSRALKGKRDISKETRKKIKQIADELGYVPHAMAANLRSQTSRTIGVIVTYMDNPFYARILQGINDALAKHGFQAITWGNNESIKQEQQILQNFAAYRVAGILIVPACDLQNNLDYDALKTRYIAITRKSVKAQSYIAIDSYKSGALVAEHFAEIGRKRPAYLGLDLPISSNYDRRLGYKETLERLGLTLESRHDRSCSPSAKSAYLTLTEWVKENITFDSIFVCTDQLAFGVLRACHDLGIKVPDDIAIVGHDDVDNAKFSIPSLTTVRVPKYTLGYSSAETIIQMIKNKNVEPHCTKTVTPKLIVRESSC